MGPKTEPCGSPLEVGTDGDVPEMINPNLQLQGKQATAKSDPERWPGQQCLRQEDQNDQLHLRAAERFNRIQKKNKNKTKTPCVPETKDTKQSHFSS